MDIYDEEGNVIRVAETRQSWWAKWGGSSLIIAGIIHAIALLAGAFWVFTIVPEVEKTVDFLPPSGGGGERGAEHQIQKKRAQITPATNVKRVIAEGAVASYAIPEQGDSFGEMSTLSSLSGGSGGSGGLGGGLGSGFAKGNGIGPGGLGIGADSNKLFGLIPENMRKRCSKDDRLQRLKENGGTAACDDAVTNGLRWLKSTQNPDGSWTPDQPVAMTGLALLAYFGHCETPASEEFGDSCMKAIVYLVNVGMKNAGKMAVNFTSNAWSYEHAIATYALGEALTFCKELKVEIPGLVEVTQKAGQFIIDNQNKNGGWAYLYGTEEGAHTDVSVAGWQIQALKACSHTNIKYKGMGACISKALEYLKSCQLENGGFGYNAPVMGEAGYLTLTGVGMLCYQMWNKGNRSEVRNAAKYIMENSKFDYNTEFCDLYGHYYESQAMMHMGGEYWKFYNEMFRDQLLNNQDVDGSWKVPGGGLNPRAIAPLFMTDKHYRTTLCILMLEVYYRFLNTGGGGAGGRPGI